MPHLIYKSPLKVTLAGLVGCAIYFALAVLLFRGNYWYPLVLGGGLVGLALLFVKSLVAYFVSALTVTDDAIETVTDVGGIIRIRFDELDRERTTLSELGLHLVPRKGETIVVSVAEYSRHDIEALARRIGIS